MNKKNTRNEINKKIAIENFLQRETKRDHHTYEDELGLYELIRDGDLHSIDAHNWFFNSNFVGKLSNDNIRNKRYIFIVATTLSTRFAIEGGLESQLAYNISDSYIQKMDTLETVEEIFALEEDMVRHFTEEVSKTKQECPDTSSDSIGKYIYKARDFIYYHLQERISISDIADHIGLSPNYLNNLFKKETGQTIKQYITSQRIEAAKNMLLYSEYSESDIGEFLAFSSESHFISVFNRIVGMTPKQYQNRYFRTHPEWKQK
ncbi:MAG: AraC family transcriptional regulator [Lachnospiraceae bacterium]|nr:AraC family transcriptional regulator [Lachnospiraceae bacterium]